MKVSLGAEIWNSGSSPVSLLQQFGTLQHLDSIHKRALKNQGKNISKYSSQLSVVTKKGGNGNFIGI